MKKRLVKKLLKKQDVKWNKFFDSWKEEVSPKIKQFAELMFSKVYDKDVKVVIINKSNKED